MATIFPGSASVGQIYNGYTFNGTAWEIQGEEWKPIIYSPTPPDHFEAGFIWVDSNEIAQEVDLTQYITASATQTLTNKVISGSANYLSEIPQSAVVGLEYALNNIDLSSASAAAVTYLVDSAPATLDTLNELAAALNDDANFAGTVTTSLAGKLDISTASSTYLTQVSASNTYLTQTSASTQYEKLIPYSSSTPSSPSTGDLWVDSSTTPPALKTYNGSSWVQLGSAVDDAQAIIAGSMFMG